MSIGSPDSTKCINASHRTVCKGNNSHFTQNKSEVGNRRSEGGLLRDAWSKSAIFLFGT